MILPPYRTPKFKSPTRMLIIAPTKQTRRAVGESTPAILPNPVANVRKRKLQIKRKTPAICLVTLEDAFADAVSELMVLV